MLVQGACLVRSPLFTQSALGTIWTIDLRMDWRAVNYDETHEIQPHSQVMSPGPGWGRGGTKKMPAPLPFSSLSNTKGACLPGMDT